MSSCVRAHTKTMSAALFLIFSLITCSSALCPPGAGWRKSAIDPTKCYLVVTSRKIWFEAEMFCVQNVNASNGHLVSISQAYETYNINSIVIDTHDINVCDQLWIGASDFEENGTFTWTDGRPFSYTNWLTGQPDLSDQCVSSQARTTGKWRTSPCGTENCFICENYDGPPLPTTTTAIATTRPTTRTTNWLTTGLTWVPHGSTSAQQTLPRDCSEIVSPHDGNYFIQLSNGNIVEVWCDMTDGGWTVIQKRVADGVDFNRSYTQYQSNFGNAYSGSSYWLGLDNIHSMTMGDRLVEYSLKIEMCCQTIQRSEFYNYFSIKDSSTSYQLNVSQGTGAAGDGFHDSNFGFVDNGAPFSAIDAYNGNLPIVACGTANFGGWWFGSCQNNLNGYLYSNPADYANLPTCQLNSNRPNGAGIVWAGTAITHTKARMKIIPRSKVPHLNEGQQRDLFCNSEN